MVSSGPPRIEEYPQKAEDITADWLAGVLRANGLDVDVATVSAKAIGTGQISTSYRIAIGYNGEVPKDAPRTLIAKMVSTDPASRQLGLTGRNYEREALFYRTIAPMLRRAGMRIARCWAAEYAPEREATIVLLEDLAPGEPGDQIRGCPVAAAELVMKQMAILHATMWETPELWATTSWLGDPREPRDTTAFCQLFADHLWPGFVDRYKDRLTPDMLALGNRFATMLGTYIARRAGKGPYTMQHVDYRVDNVIFSPPGKDGEPEWCYTLDWQSPALGLGAVDVGYFLGASLRPEDRRAHQERLLRLWHDEVTRLGVKDYSFEAAWDGFKHGQFAGMLTAVYAGMLVGRTDRGDEMFWAMFSRAFETAMETNAIELLPE
ncbi:kinase-like domain-containing protein [Hyaloraphidium curvatum]|nr:kinase-like domain-containing protein [Hyaloraphidium curvatum]